MIAMRLYEVAFNRDVASALTLTVRLPDANRTDAFDDRTRNVTYFTLPLRVYLTRTYLAFDRTDTATRPALSCTAVALIEAFFRLAACTTDPDDTTADPAAGTAAPAAPGTPTSTDITNAQADTNTPAPDNPRRISDPPSYPISVLVLVVPRRALPVPRRNCVNPLRESDTRGAAWCRPMLVG